MAFLGEQKYSQRGGRGAIKKRPKSIGRWVKGILPDEDNFGEHLSFWDEKGYMYQGHIATRAIGEVGSCPAHMQSLATRLPTCIVPRYSLG